MKVIESGKKLRNSLRPLVLGTKKFAASVRLGRFQQAQAAAARS